VISAWLHGTGALPLPNVRNAATIKSIGKRKNLPVLPGSKKAMLHTLGMLILALLLWGAIRAGRRK